MKNLTLLLILVQGLLLNVASHADPTWVQAGHLANTGSRKLLLSNSTLINESNLTCPSCQNLLARPLDKNKTLKSFTTGVFDNKSSAKLATTSEWLKLLANSKENNCDDCHANPKIADNSFHALQPPF